MMIRSIKLLSLLLTVLLASFSRWQVQSFAVAAEKNRFGSRLALFPRKTEINQSTIASHDRLDDAKPKSYFTQFYNWYNDCLLERPILTKGVTAGVVNLLGDTLAQYIAASKTGAAFVPDVVRLQAFFLCGLVYTGPMVHWWNEQLIKFGDWIKENYSSRNQVQVLAQLGLDQTVGVVLLTCTYFYAFELIEALVRYRSMFNRIVQHGPL